MKVLVIPDVHLKPWMFHRASELMKDIKPDRAVCLMDIADDWRQQFNLDLYVQTYDAAIAFAKEYPETLWCYGNHDVCYLWNQRETGYSKIAPWTVCEKLRVLRESLPDERQLAYLHRLDNVLFSHGGLADAFVRRYVPAGRYNDIDAVVNTINGFGCGEMWQGAVVRWTTLRSRSTDRVGRREHLLFSIGRSITKSRARTATASSPRTAHEMGKCINPGSFCRWWDIRRLKR